MTCYTRCGNFCCPNTPRPIFVFGDCDNNNSVINPVVLSSFGFFENNLGGTVPANTIIPVALTSSQGNNVSASSTTAGTITLAPGRYEITYFVNGTLPASTTMSVALRANGVQVAGSTSTASGTAGNQTTLTKTIVLTVLSTTTLELYNNGTDALTISNANILVKEI